MCSCGKPTKNGESGYRWNGPIGTYPLSPPPIEEGDIILFDEPGRCGGQDSHAYHYRLIRSEYGRLQFLVRHGGGDERIPYLSNGEAFVRALNALDSDGRYWVLNTIYHAQSNAKRKAAESEAERWRQAAAEKRIKTRKFSSRGTIKVWIETAISKTEGRD